MTAPYLVQDDIALDNALLRIVFFEEDHPLTVRDLNHLTRAFAGFLLLFGSRTAMAKVVDESGRYDHLRSFDEQKSERIDDIDKVLHAYSTGITFRKISYNSPLEWVAMLSGASVSLLAVVDRWAKVRENVAKSKTTAVREQLRREAIRIVKLELNTFVEQGQGLPQQSGPRQQTDPDLSEEPPTSPWQYLAHNPAYFLKRVDVMELIKED